MFRQIVQFLKRYFYCDHRDRVLAMIVREPVTYTRQAQYYCPDCQHVWNTWKLPEGLR